MKSYRALALGTGFALAILALSSVLAHAAPQGTAEAIAAAGEASATGRIVQMVVGISVLSVAPGLLVMVTSFTRFVIALSFLRSGIGLQTTPANLILVSLALFMTFYVMAPTFDEAWQNGLKPLVENRMDEKEAFPRIVEPFKTFMKANVRPKDLALFSELAEQKLKLKADAGDVELRVLIPAFMVSELRRGFEIGFLIVLPFLVIDLIVATLTMSMGMMMLPPTAISLPFKVLFFILVDGWSHLAGSLVRSYF